MLTKNEYISLLTEWCDRLIELQLSTPEKELDGGIICPACHFIHGRCGDAIYPFITLYDITGDKKYFEAAKKLFFWTENNMSRPDGAVINDSMNLWKGISVFYATTLLETLLEHGAVLDREIYGLFEKRTKKLLDFLIPYLKTVFSAINYPAAMCGALALAYKLFGDEYYLKSAREYAEFVTPYLNDEGFLVGEPKRVLEKSPKGCLPVDIGYNLEESIPALITYCKIIDDKPFFEKVLKAAYTHLDFFLPDGGIDNSFGTRNAKWSYWGSRTSDGCQSGFADLSDIDKRFGEATQRNFKLLKKCTKNGALYGGAMYIEGGERPCTHHTFCHAKGLAHLIDRGFEYKESASLPFDKGDKIKSYKTTGATLLRCGAWRASLNIGDCQMPYGNDFSTATLTLLQHDSVGTILAASMPNYNVPEPTNMQYSIHTDMLCSTPRIECETKNGVYTNICDRAALLKADGNHFTVSGKLRNADGEGLFDFLSEYDFSYAKAVITYKCDADAKAYLPIVSKAGERVETKEDCIYLYRENAIIKIESNQKLSVPTLERNLNPVGGFQNLIITAPLKAGTALSITLTVE